jgi:hypothetical protein
MNPTDRFTVLWRGRPVFTTNERMRLVAFLWGCDTQDAYVVLDGERPYPVDDPNLLAWMERIPDEEQRMSNDVSADLDPHRPYGTTRESFFEMYPEVRDQIEQHEHTYGPFERIATISLRDGRVVCLARYATAWYINFLRPGEAPTMQDLQCFLSPEAMIALWGLHEYLRTPQTHAQDWEAFLEAITPGEDQTS